MLDWNDLRILLAVARAGSTLAAARRLGISQTTAARRIAALEEALGVSLFDRRQDGYSLTEAGRGFLAPAEQMEQAAAGLQALAEAQRRNASGTVRVTTIDLAAHRWILPALPEFQEAHPAVRIELLTVEERLDILRGEADIGIRFGPRPTEPALVIRPLGLIRSALYASEAYLAARGRPADLPALNDHAVIRGSGWIDTRPQHRWLAEIAPRATIAYRSNSTIGILDAIRMGLGIGSLPVGMAEAEPGLVQIFPPPEEHAAPVWLVTSDAARRQPHIRAFLDFITPRLLRALR